MVHVVPKDNDSQIFLFWYQLHTIVTAIYIHALTQCSDDHCYYITILLSALSVPDEGYWVYLMKVIPETRSEN